MADFFEPGKTYIQANAFRPPEDLLMFRCRLVEEHPRCREPRAFGWIATVYPGDNWASAVRNPGDWNCGWSEYEEPQPEGNEPPLGFCACCGKKVRVADNGNASPHVGPAGWCKGEDYPVEQAPTVVHDCDNCDGIAPETCLFNPDREA